jgi:membrane protein
MTTRAAAAVTRLGAAVRGLIEPLVRAGALDRSLALGAQAFSALVPLLIVLEAAEPGDRSLADDLVRRFHLHGAAATSVRQAFAVAPSDESTVTALGVVVLVVSVLSFTRRLQRLYEDTWKLDARSWKGTGWGLAWIALLTVWLVLHPLLDGAFTGRAAVVLSLAGVLLIALLTPYVLLGRRLPWRTLLPQAGLCAAGLVALGVWTTIYMPRAIASSAGRYGAIGVAFAMLTWLWGMGIVLVGSAVYGPQLTAAAAPGARRDETTVSR